MRGDPQLVTHASSSEGKHLADWILKAKYKKETSRGSDSRKTGVIV